MRDIFKLGADECLKALNQQQQHLSETIKDKGNTIFLAEWITGKPADQLPTHTFAVSSNKSVSTDPGRARFTDSFMEIPDIKVDPLPSPLDISVLHKDVLVGVPPQEQTDEIHLEKKALDSFLSWVSLQIGKYADNAVVKALFERLQTGGIACQQEIQTKIPSSKVLIQDPQKIEALLDDYQKTIEERETILKEKEKAILAFANDLHGNQKVALEILRDQRRPFDIETLLIAFGRKDKTAIHHANPTLADDEVASLMTQVGHYALLKSECQQLDRCKEKLNDYLSLLAKSDQEAIVSASNSYFTEAEAKRCYDPAAEPRVLAFEVLGNMLVRKEQFNALTSLSGLSSTERWKLYEARTGFGKSKVLLPLWLLLSSESKGLAIMTVHSNLFDQQEAYLQKVFKDAYKFFGTRIDFSRDSPVSKEDIAEIEQTLRTAEALRRPVFMSDQTLHNLLILKIKEIAQLQSTADDYGTLEALLSLRRYIKEKGHLFVDEPHKVLNDGEESNYSIGHPQGFRKERLQFGLNLYKHLFSAVEGTYRLEFWHSPTTEHLPLLTEEQYKEHVLPKLLDKVIQEEKMTLDSDGLKYLQGAMSFAEQCLYEENLAKSSNDDAEKIRILHDQLFSYFPQTLMRNADEHYALLSPLSSRTAIPMESARNPKEGNEFVRVDQILNFTIQANLNTPFPQELIEETIEELASRAIEEVDAGSAELKETASYKKFALLFKGQPWCNLLKMTPKDYRRLHQEINESLLIRLQFIGLTVLPQLRRYDEKITSNPHLLVNCFNQVAGAAGTLSMQHLPYQFNVEVDEKAMVKTLIALIKKYDLLNETVVEFAANTSQEIAKNLHALVPDASVALEVGAVMRDYPSLLDLAQDILEQAAEFDGVATFDSKGTPIVLVRGQDRFIEKEQVSIPAEKLFWFYGQKDTTGTDQALPPLAKAVLFINKDTTLTEFIQGAGRMRSLLAKQHVVIACDQDTSSIIKKFLKKSPADPLSLLDIFDYCASKDGEKGGLSNFHSLSKQWNALLENAFWDASLQAKAEDVANDFQLFRKDLVDANPDQPLLCPSVSTKAVNINEALAVQKERFNKKRLAMEIKAQDAQMQKLLVQSLSKEHIEPITEVIQNKMAYPPEMHISESGEDTQHAQATVEQLGQGIEQVVVDILGKETAEAESETVTDTTQTQLWTNWAQKVNGRRALPHTDTIKAVPASRIFSGGKLKKFSHLFKEVDLHISENAACTFEGETIYNPGWANGYVKPLHYIVQRNGKWILIDQQEAENVIKNKRCETLWLVNEGVLIDKEGQSTQSFKDDPDFCKREVIAKLLNGDLLFDDVQWKHFVSWFDALGEERGLLGKFIEEVLFDLHPLLEDSSEYQRLEPEISSFSKEYQFKSESCTIS
jgi:hypothetical protein